MGEGHVGVAVRDLMEKRALSLGGLARTAQIAPADLVALLNGDADWTAAALLAVADALRVPPLPLFRLASRRAHHLKAVSSI